MNEAHISRISTIWTLVRQAHGESGELGRESAQEQIMRRYSGAIYRYLLKLLGSEDDADEVFQEFALNLVRGAYRNASPVRGRFRDYVKICVVHLVGKFRRQRTPAARLDVCDLELAADDLAPDQAMESAFRESCREELLARVWDRLRAQQEQSGHSYFTLLQYRASHPEATSQQAADDLNRQLGEGAFTPVSVRKTLQRARARFAELLLDEVRQTLPAGDPDQLQQELADLQLHVWCRPALETGGPDGSGGRQQDD